MAEALGYYADLEAADTLAEGLGIACGLDAVLARIHAVLAGNRLKQQGVVFDGCCHRARVVDGGLDRHDAGVGHELRTAVTN